MKEETNFEDFTKQSLKFRIWVLYTVYGWPLKKITKMRATSLDKWVSYAKKRATVGNLLQIFEFDPNPKKERSLWEKMRSKIRL